MLKDSLFNKIEQKTNINKDTILKLADKLQKNNMKDENTIREIINDISNMTGKEVSKEKADKIVNAIKNDKVPKNLDKML
ncbi:MAG: stage VI sporulation protein F [Bacilli bacterium]|nr:stage VI sporulation protein F [Bacilli bacterium]